MFRFLTLVLVALSPLAFGDTPYSAVDQDYPKQVFWGDTHLHTRNSADAYSLGNLNLSPADAYRFARGQELMAHNGMRVQLKRPLDFLVVSDHSEYLGGFYRFNVRDRVVTDTPTGRQWSQYIADGDLGKFFTAFTASLADPANNYPLPKTSQKVIWQDVAQTADEFNDPGQFSAIIGYEWTSMIRGNNLHRVVLYKDGADVVGQVPPFTAQESLDPQDLWRALASYEEKTGGEVMAIAHNGNISNGMMFPSVTVDGEPIDRAYAELRRRWEPVYEVSQVKGDGEAHPTLSPDDEFADFETWDEDNIGRSEKKQDWMLAHEYARSALKLGLQYEDSLGVNPFKFGMIASTDGHNTFSTTEEDNFFGKFPESEPGAQRLKNTLAGVLWENWKIVASGYAAIWSQENTRASLFDAMKRREVYGTTGSRIMVRFFGGWGYDEGAFERPDYLDVAYKGGVPMGGDLTLAPKGQAPKFIAVAAKDPVGANLDRVQIVKGWVDHAGKVQEKVYDVAWSDDRKMDAKTGKVPSVGTTVDVETATYRNSIGSAELGVVWEDPDFDPALRAFYYARVIEIPKPRWSTYDAAYFEVDLAEEVPRTVQDRAYTSPIWYTP
ncbi:MAG: hypothetical protein ACI8Z1_000045 [Candidatus Azotimanducaceae bacterium]|jgi:hypothetical protein